MTAETTKNWPATHAFVKDAKSVEQILGVALDTVRSLQHDATTRGGGRNEQDVDAINAVLGHAQLLCEAVAPLDGGRLVREQL